MKTTRSIQKIIKAKPTLEGAGVHLKRVFGFSEAPMFDPFLLMDDFRNDHKEHYIKGFPWHPHRGIETITYVLTGDVEHGDSLGNKGVIGSGDVQWMTAGSGIIHQEMPIGDASGKMYGFQLWANLPAKDKMTDPKYRDVKSEDIPEVVLDGDVKVKIICGEAGGVKGPVNDIVIEPSYLDFSIPKNTRLNFPVDKGHTVFAYVIGGKGFFCEKKNPFTYEVEGESWSDMEREPYVENGSLVFFSDGDEIKVLTEEDGMRFLLISGKPINEPVAWQGPVVMNTRDELKTAFEEYKNGTFIKYKGS